MYGIDKHEIYLLRISDVGEERDRYTTVLLMEGVMVENTTAGYRKYVPTSFEQDIGTER